MALYVYKALTRTGKQTSGQLEAASVGAVREELVTKKLYPISIELKPHALISVSIRLKSHFPV